MPQFIAPRPKVHITFIGGGTMACAMLDGLANASLPSSNSSSKLDYSISITARRQERVLQLQDRYPSTYVTDNNDDVKLWQLPQKDISQAHIVLICTQPQSTMDVCESIRLAYNKTSPITRLPPTVVTMCPGITVSELETWLTTDGDPNPFPVIRTMPNTPMSIRQGATAMFASHHTTASQLDYVVELFRISSPCVEILDDESLLDVAAAVSGSGPAYILAFSKALVAAGVGWGLSETAARSLVLQTVTGASTLAIADSEVSLSAMIQDVCVPGGSTEKGIRVLVNHDIESIVKDAVGTSIQANRNMKGHQ